MAALFRANATKEARWRFFMATSMGATHTSGRPLKLEDFLPPEPQKPNDNWRDMLAATRAFVAKSKQLRALHGRKISESELAGIL